jgi:hypothetical protein
MLGTQRVTSGMQPHNVGLLTLLTGTKPGILMIGDSTDRQLIEAVCPQRPTYFSDEADESPTFRALQCSLPGLDIAIYPIWGIFTTGDHMRISSNGRGTAEGAGMPPCSSLVHPPSLNASSGQQGHKAQCLPDLQLDV